MNKIREKIENLYYILIIIELYLEIIIILFLYYIVALNLRNNF